MPNPADWTPTLDDVGALLHARTRTAGGAEVGTFTSDTRPTADEATKLIDQAALELVPFMDNEPVAPDPTDTKYLYDWDGSLFTADLEAYTARSGRWEALNSQARSVAMLRAAMLIELSFFPDEAMGGEGQLAYQTLRLSYESALRRLRPRKLLV